MSGIFSDLLKAGLDMANQNNPNNNHNRGQGGSVLESMGDLFNPKTPSQNPLNQQRGQLSPGNNSGGLLDSLGGLLGGNSQSGGQGGGLGDMLGGLLGGNDNAGTTQQGQSSGGLGGLLQGKKGALIAGGIGMLLTSSAGRKIAGKLAKIGGIGAIGAMAMKAYKNFQDNGGTAEQVTQNSNPQELGQTVNEIDDEQQQEKRSFMIMKAMIAAAKADGQVDAEEQQAIRDQMDNMGLDDSDLHALKDELTKPLDAVDVASVADSPSAAAEMYIVSKLVIDVDSSEEVMYLENLADALDLTPEMVKYLDQQVAQV